MSDESMRTARLRIKSNEGVVAVSSAHPGATFAIRGAWPDGDRLRLLLETEDVDPAALRRTLDRVPAIRDVARRSAADALARFEVATPRPESHGAAGESGVVPAFPQTVEDGWIAGKLTASREQLIAFRDELDEAGIQYRVDFVGSDREPDRLLTERQRQVVELAFERGYYDSPRECTVTDLADALGVDKSAVSRLLQRAEGRIVGSYLG